MTFRQFQAAFRPLLNRAWLAQCERTGVAPNNRTAKDTWYREQLLSCCGIRSSKAATANQQPLIIGRFQQLAGAAGSLHITGWSDAQNARFEQLARKAWTIASLDITASFDSWINYMLQTCGVFDRTAADCKESFD